MLADRRFANFLIRAALRFLSGHDAEAEKALRLFCEAALQETATVELVRRVLGEVERR